MKARKNANKPRDFFEMMSRLMSPASVRRAEAKARKTILAIRLAELRKHLGRNQSQVKGFTQPDVSKIESRKDLKLSTLIDYCRGIGAEVTILVRPVKHRKKTPPFVLLKS